MMKIDTEIRNQFRYEAARDEGHDYMSENPNAGYAELQAHCYNFLMEVYPELGECTGLCDKLAHMAAKRAHHMSKMPSHRFLLELPE
tara:strand:+ start:934 stop:1194 length:261 start_codon:yes stop_codon:yes gene_type:complete